MVKGISWSGLGRLSHCAVIALAIGGGLTVARAAETVPANLGLGLGQLVQHQAAANAVHVDAAGKVTAPAVKPLGLTQFMSHPDAQGRVLVSVHLDGKRPIADLASALTQLGARPVGQNARVGKGVISAYIPLTQAIAIGKLSGVKSVLLAYRPHTHVGLVTSEGAAVLHTDVLNAAGLDGTGMTIGVMSDSYDTYGGPITAADDIASGDLPGPGNPLGHTTPITVLAEMPVADQPGTDEGRAMLQIVHDLAPGAHLCFATAYDTDADFANNILALADPTQACKADVIVDDVGYFDEPIFSDGPIAQAATAVTKAGVAYFSAAGNANSTGYDTTFNPVPDAVVRAGLPGNNIDWTQVPDNLTAGGFHNFATSGPVQVTQSVTISGQSFVGLQWNDPFNAGAVTANYVILAFDAQGNFVGVDNAGAGDAIAADEPLQFLYMPFPTDGSVTSVNYQIVLAKATTAPSPATRLRYYDVTDGADGLVQNEWAQLYSPTTYGHPDAAGPVASVAADYWGGTKGIEYFSSLGPTTIYFDENNNRLAAPVIRKKPDLAAVDGVSTTFFGQTVANSNFQAFFGTSAAAPHAAAVGALVLEAAGGSGSLTPAQLLSTLQTTTLPHSINPGFIQGSAGSGRNLVHLTATGFEALNSVEFSLSLGPATGPIAPSAANTQAAGPGHSLVGLTMDLTNSGMWSRTAGFFSVGASTGINPNDMVLTTTKFPSYTMSWTFPKGEFVAYKSIQFGFDFNFASIHTGGHTVNDLGGTTFTATFDDGSTATGTLTNATASGYTVADGFGLVNGLTAVEAVLNAAPAGGTPSIKAK